MYVGRGLVGVTLAPWPVTLLLKYCQKLVLKCNPDMHQSLMSPHCGDPHGKYRWKGGLRLDTNGHLGFQ